jgi:hypothetical protein
MAGLFGGGHQRLMRQAAYLAPRIPREERPAPAPIVQGTQARTRDQAQQAGLIGGAYKNPAAQGWWAEVMSDPFTALGGRAAFDRKYAAQAAEDEARRMAPVQERISRFQDALPDRDFVASHFNPEEFGKNLAEHAGTQTGTFWDGKQWNQKPQDMMTVSEGAAVYDPQSGAPVFTNRRPEQPYTLSPGQVRMLGNEEIARGPDRPPSNGINLSFGEDGGLAGLSIGGPQMPLSGDGPKGKGPAVIAGPGGEVRVSPGQQQLVQNRDWQRIQSAEAQSNLVREDIRKALGLVGPNTTGAWASTKDLLFVGASTDSGRLANALATIKANVGFDNLQTMRENSPTGGALGAVTEKEIAFLQAMQGSLEQAQTPADLAANLKRLDEFFAGREQRRREAFAQDYPELAEFAGFAKRTSNEVKRLSKDTNKAVEEYNALEKGDRYIDDDGNERTKQ